MELIQSVYNFFTSPLFRFILNFIGIYILLLWLSTVVWTYRDARRRGAMALSWAALALAFPFLGVIIYLLMRPAEYEDEAELRELEMAFKEMLLKKELQVCPACHKPVEEDYQVCPYCLKKLKKPCRNCGKLLKLDWAVCPYCKAEQ
jgi:RNA polymerase subunit RPABC4/transcription elongation factor Spt4